MENKKLTFKKAAKFLLDLFEIYIPSIAFLGIFIIFVWQIIKRYVFVDPLTWSYDATMILYVYAIMFGSCYTLRANEHISFSLIYDSAGERAKCVMRIIGNLVITAIFILAFKSSIEYGWILKSSRLKKTAVLKLEYRYIYLSFLFLIADSIVRMLARLVKDFMTLFSKKREDSEE